MRLPRLMIGILPDDDHLHLIEGTEIEGIEDEFARRIAHRMHVLRAHRLRQLCEIRLLELGAEISLPTLLNLYAHKRFFENLFAKVR